MNTLKDLGRRGAGLVAAALAASLLSSGAWAAPPQETVTVRAAALQAEADRHAERAAFYRERAVLGSKQLITYFTLANHCEQEANRYRLAASETGRIG
jgi:hypothetical protein